MGAKQDKAKDDIESLRSLPLDKQLSMLNGTLNVKNVTAKSMKAALPTLVLFNKSYHPSKDLMMGQPLFNCPSLINTLITKYLTFDGAGDEALKVPALTATIHTLGLLAREDGARYAIIEAEAIPLIVAAMNCHPDQADLLEYSLFALGNLSLHSEGKNAIMNLDGVSLISRIMMSHKSSPGVLERACFTLGNLAYHESCKRVILEAGCVEVAVEAAKAHPDASQFLLETCFFFSNMSVIPSGRSLVISLGGLQIVIDAMQCHQTIAELLDLACTAIYNISLDPAGRKLIDEVGALEIVLKSISNNLHAASFLSEAIGSVGRLFLESEQNIIRLIKSRASELILEAKARHEEDATVTTTASAVLGQLAECEDVHFQTIPAVPTLKELSGRVILNHPAKSLARLPNDLIEYLQASTQRCDCCGKVWIESRFELITMETLKGFQRKLPVYHQLCSPDCFAKKKNVPEPVPAEPSAEPIVQIHAH